MELFRGAYQCRTKLTAQIYEVIVLQLVDSIQLPPHIKLLCSVEQVLDSRVFFISSEDFLGLESPVVRVGLCMLARDSLEHLSLFHQTLPYGSPMTQMLGKVQPSSPTPTFPFLKEISLGTRPSQQEKGTHLSGL